METKFTYYLGLDMGTDSLGWAVTDSSYHILRAKGKDLWGVRLFPAAETSVDRRTYRVNRRRRQREVARIGALKELFADEIAVKTISRSTAYLRINCFLMRNIIKNIRQYFI